MTDNKPSVLHKERRLKNRWQIPKSLDAKVTIWIQQESDDVRNETEDQYWQGCLGNICDAGAQIIVNADCWEHLRTNHEDKA